jgi:DNA-binding IclR family transcriptional regulator
VPSEELQGFIRANLRSVWELELLLLMSREPSRAWGVDELNRELRGSISLVSEILGKLERVGVVAEAGDGAYRYDPKTPELARIVAQLERDYAARPLAIVRAILDAPNEKIQTLADAFKVKKD